jgi:hypothetical protein
MLEPLVWSLLEGRPIDPTSVHMLQTMMINDMLTQLERQCKGIYHHALEWTIDESILKENHTFIHAYLGMIKRFPKMVPGQAFIPMRKG